MKCKHTIINEMGDNVAHLCEAKADYYNAVADEFEKNGKNDLRDEWRKMAIRANLAAEILHEMSGCLA